MSDYLVRMEKWTDQNGYPKSRIRPVKEIIGTSLFDINHSKLEIEDQFGTIAIWDTPGTNTKRFNDGEYVICSDLTAAAFDKNEKGRIVIYDTVFDKLRKRDKSLLNMYKEIVEIDGIDSQKTFQQYFRDEKAAYIDHVPFSNEIYVSDGNHVYGPLMHRAPVDGRYQIYIPSRLDGIVDVFDFDFDDEDAISDISYRNDDGSYTKLAVVNTSLLAKLVGKIDCLTDDDLKSDFQSVIEKNTSAKKGVKPQGSPWTILKNIAKQLPTRGWTEDRTARMTSLIENGENYADIARTIYLDNPEDVFEKIKDQEGALDFLFEKGSSLKERLYGHLKDKYKGKLDSLFAEFGYQEEIHGLQKTIREKSEEIEKLQEQLKEKKENPDQTEEIERLREKNREQFQEILRLQGQIIDLEEDLKTPTVTPEITEDAALQYFRALISPTCSEELFRRVMADIQGMNEAYDKAFKISASLQQLQGDLKALKEDEEEIKGDIERKKREIKGFEKNLKEQQDTLNEKIDALPEYYQQISFDGALSSRMLEAAAKYQREIRDKQNSADVVTIERVIEAGERNLVGTEGEVIDFVHHTLVEQAKRKGISKNDVVNIMLCLSQGFLTILAGEPGTGKTSLVNCLAETLGYAKGRFPRYTEVAVEKGWTSKRDLIGYYNPLTKSFDAANGALYNALQILDQEAQQGIEDYPYLVLLDEANLSQMEHYWADFMGLCDLQKSVRKVSLDRDYKIPQTLRFMATINLDHTTETISPRLVDRAWIIRLEANDMDFDAFDREEIVHEGMVLFSTLNSLADKEFTSPQDLSGEVRNRFKKIHELYREKLNISLSTRIVEMIARYCVAASKLMNMAFPCTALDYAVAQKILPMINGYGEDYAKFIDELIALCRNYKGELDMPISYRLLNDIKRKATANMQYYQYFAR